MITPLQILEGIIIGVAAGLTLSAILLIFRFARDQYYRWREKQDIIQAVKLSEQGIFEDSHVLAREIEAPVEKIQSVCTDAFIFTATHLIKNKSSHMNKTELRDLHGVLFWWKIKDSIIFSTQSAEFQFVFNTIERVDWIRRGLK